MSKAIAELEETETLTEAEIYSLGTMESDEDSLMDFLFSVSEQLGEKIKDQYERLRDVDMSLNHVERYRVARSMGVLAAIAKGIRGRAFREGEVFIPKTELIVSEGKVRITSLKATLAIPAGLKVQSVVFRIGDDGVSGAVLASQVAS
jgi:hypothetical protein